MPAEVATFVLPDSAFGGVHVIRITGTRLLPQAALAAITPIAVPPVPQ